jgi:hypothetical protein
MLDMVPNHPSSAFSEAAEAGSPAGQSSEFADLFCELCGCPRHRFERVLFDKSLYLHARLIAPLILWLSPHTFEEDFGVIQEVASVKDPEIFRTEVNRFHGRNRRDASFLRTVLLIRISGKRLMSWRDRVFE